MNLRRAVLTARAAARCQLVAVVMLAVAIGADAAVFSIVRAVLCVGCLQRAGSPGHALGA